MRHRVKKAKLNRSKDQRIAMIRAQAKSLLTNTKFVTTKQKAKETKRFIDKLLSRIQTTEEVAAIAFAEKQFGDRKFAQFILKEVKPKLGDTKTGFTRIFKLGNRPGDNAQMVQMALIVEKKKKKTIKEKKKEESKKK